ncbi:small heat shock protein [Tricholoma matsutake]|nr:small heat shock protein [Tricholoma matsutake 945]
MSSVWFYEPFYDLDRFIDESFGGRWDSSGQRRRIESGESGGAVRAIKPRMDLHENSANNSVTATFELPGMQKEGVSIDVHNGRLTVSGETKMSSEHEESGYAVRERKYGKFARTLQLPQGVKEDEIKASMEDGVLYVTFPKSAPDLAPKKISIA